MLKRERLLVALYPDSLQDRWGLSGRTALLGPVTLGQAGNLQVLELTEHLVELGRTLSNKQKEDIAVMALKVIAADGRREISEMEQFNRAVDAVGVSPEIVHRAFDRYFKETMPGGRSG